MNSIVDNVVKTNGRFSILPPTLTFNLGGVNGVGLSYIVAVVEKKRRTKIINFLWS